MLQAKNKVEAQGNCTLYYTTEGLRTLHTYVMDTTKLLSCFYIYELYLL